MYTLVRIKWIPYRFLRSDWRYVVKVRFEFYGGRECSTKNGTVQWAVWRWCSSTYRSAYHCVNNGVFTSYGRSIYNVQWVRMLTKHLKYVQSQSSLSNRRVCPFPQWLQTSQQCHLTCHFSGLSAFSPARAFLLKSYAFHGWILANHLSIKSFDWSSCVFTGSGQADQCFKGERCNCKMKEKKDRGEAYRNNNIVLYTTLGRLLIKTRTVQSYFSLCVGYSQRV